VYKITEELAIVQTVDFFTPIVDDPYTFGKIAAANALSDIYAMGARPLTAMNIIAISRSIGMDVAREILRGGADVIREAGALVIGGHSVDDNVPKYGLAVTGLVDPRKMITNRGAKHGDALILTKRLGVGILNNIAKRDLSLVSTALHAHHLEQALRDEMETAMMRLNRHASETMLEFSAHACTDITGFGFLGHARNIAEASGVRLVVEYSKVPRYDGAETHAKPGAKGCGERNYKWVKDFIEVAKEVTQRQVDVLCDPQTSGGLFIAVAPDKADAMLARLHEGGDTPSAIVGWADDGQPGTILINP
jgi:selenide,water dikinase